MLRLCTITFWLLLLGLNSAAVTAGLPVLVLNNEQLQQPVAVPALRVLQDARAELTASEVLPRIATQGELVQGIPQLGYSASAWWLAFELDAPAAERLLLIIDRPALDDIEVWLYSRDRLITPLYSGITGPFWRGANPRRM
jgi:hypothetical protein